MEAWEIEAREVIRDLVARYNVCGDRAQIDSVVELFAPEAVLEIGPRELRPCTPVGMRSASSSSPTRPVGNGRVVRRRPHVVRHFVSTHEMMFHDERRASGRSYFLVLMAHGLDHWGRYFDEYGAVDAVGFHQAEGPARGRGRGHPTRRGLNVDRGRVPGATPSTSTGTSRCSPSSPAIRLHGPRSPRGSQRSSGPSADLELRRAVIVECELDVDREAGAPSTTARSAARPSNVYRGPVSPHGQGPVSHHDVLDVEAQHECVEAEGGDDQGAPLAGGSSRPVIRIAHPDMTWSPEAWRPVWKRQSLVPKPGTSDAPPMLCSRKP